MNESYEQELQTEINFLLHEVGYLQEEISNARASGDTDEYTRLFRVFLPRAETVFEAMRGTGKADGRGRGRTGGVQWSVTQYELYHGI